MRHACRWTLVPLLAFLLPAAAQTVTPKQIRFDGAAQYTQADLLATSKLAPGKTLTETDIEAAMHRLDDTGLFADIRYGAESGVLHFDLSPVPEAQTRTVHFNNFVMFAPEELIGKLHQQVPLFTGRVPVTGGMQQTLSGALEAVLKERGIDATVTSIGAQGGVLDFAIVTPPVVVNQVHVTGVDFASTGSLSALQARVNASEYLAQVSEDALRTSLREALLDLAYLDVNVSPIAHTVPQISASRISLDLTGTVERGSVYTVARIEVPAPAPGVTAADLERAVQLKAGGPASRVLVLSTTARLNAGFEDQGYLDAKTTVNPVEDKSVHSVSYSFRTDPGATYRIRALSAADFPAETQSALAHAWTASPGSVYQSKTLAALQASAPARTLCNGKPVDAQLRPDRSTHQVDIVLFCKRGGPVAAGSK